MAIATSDLMQIEGWILRFGTIRVDYYDSRGFRFDGAFNLILLEFAPQAQDVVITNKIELPFVQM